MQIRKIVIYNNNGNMREINFRQNTLNIITGNSSTGKTTLIDIIEYCLGDSDYRVKLRNEVSANISMFGVLYQLKDRQIFIAKQKAQTRSRSTLYFSEGIELVIPPLDKITDNSNDEEIKDYIASLLGMSENEIEPDSNMARYSANIRHTFYYLFLDNPIDNTFLFYKQGNNPLASRTIRDTMPVILNAVQVNYVELQKQLRQKRAHHRSLKLELDEANEMRNRGITLIPGLLLEAKDLGLLEDGILIDEITNGREVLSDLLIKDVPRYKDGDDNSNLIELEGRLARLQNDKFLQQAKLAQYQAYSQDVTEYQRIAGEYDHRLEMADYFEKSEDLDICPICGSQITEHNPDVHDLQDARREILKQLATVEVKHPVLTDVIDEIQTSIRLIQQEIRQVNTDIETVLASQQQLANSHNPQQRIATFLGGLKMYMRLAPISTDSIIMLEQDVKNLENEMQELQLLINDAEGLDKLETAIAEISSYMTVYGSKIGEEYRGAFFRFDLKKLTVFVAQRGDQREFGRNIGSDKNYLQIHLALYLALHRYFVVHNSPVPRFIVIDQVDRPFYPNDVNYNKLEQDNPEDLMSDPDRRALVEVFELFMEFCNEFNLQIIALQHANFPNDTYQNAIIENWRDGHALIPLDWFNDDNIYDL